ncbi:DNA transposase [Frankliniella fusca]|uniref:DNA transposase n=1 Tax=Frankliniella fusca TaxID=407009 RepID=A0AAE1H2F6_9NEOP|nr:DNA transposase [Frankliniella fusca]
MSDLMQPGHIVMHKFPVDMERMWVQKSGNLDNLKVPSERLLGRRICALHFGADQYFNKLRKSLKRGACPTLNLPEELSDEVMMGFPVSSGPALIFEAVEEGKQFALEFPLESEDIVSTVENQESATPKTPPQTQKRVTKASLRRQAGLHSRFDLTPKKKKLLDMCHSKHSEAQKIRKRLLYTAKKAKAYACRLKGQNDLQESALLTINVSQAARDLLEWERRNYSRKLNARKWLLKEKCFSLSIYKRSPKTYRYLRQHFTLPSEQTLKNVLNDIHIEPGISQVFLRILEKKTFNSLDKDKVAVLSFDEVFTEENLTYSHLLDKVNGFEDFGTRGRTHKKADHVLVFKVKLLNSDTDLPVAHYPVHATCPSDTLAVLLEDVCRAVASIGITIIASVSDQGSTNRGAINTLRGKCPQGDIDNVYQVDGKLIVHLWDFPHLPKNWRNNLLSYDLAYEENKVAQWKHIIEFFKLDEGICKISRLKYAHLAPVGRNKMRVHLAAQIFSEQNYKGMKTFHTLSGGRQLADGMQTADLLLAVDQLFDSVNGPSRTDKPKDGRCDVTPTSYHHAYWRQMIPKLKKWKFISKEPRVHLGASMP